MAAAYGAHGGGIGSACASGGSGVRGVRVIPLVPGRQRHLLLRLRGVRPRATAVLTPPDSSAGVPGDRRSCLAWKPRRTAGMDAAGPLALPHAHRGHAYGPAVSTLHVANVPPVRAARRDAGLRCLAACLAAYLVSARAWDSTPGAGP